ncbi:MAG: GAF domain-containing protein, partial [Nitrososphaera sp.]
MSRDDIFKNLDTEIVSVDESRKNGKIGVSSTSFPELLIDIKNAFSVTKTKREVACELCKIILTGLNERLGNTQIDICVIWGLIEELNTLKLKGAAGFQPRGMLGWERIKLGDGIVGQVARDKIPIITNDLRNDSRAGTGIEQNIIQLADKVAVLVYPLVLANGELVGVLLLGKFHSGLLPDRYFAQPGFIGTLDWLAPHLATTFDNAKWLNKTKLLKQYHENERRIGAISRQLYSAAIPDRNLKLMETICIECMKILNSGNPEHPFYQNFLFYEYQEYRKLFVLRS